MPDLKVVNENNEEIVSEERQAGDPVNVIADGELMRERVAQMFDLKPNELGKFKTKIDTLIDWAKTQTKDHSPENLKWAIRNLEHRVGTPPLGENRVAYLTRYAFLSLKRDEVDGEMKNYERE